MSNAPLSLKNAPWSIQTPCDERWDAMVGDDAVRHCARCDKKVHDLSAHSVDEAATLRASPTLPCIRITQRTDGAIRVREGWWLSGRAAVLAATMAACGTEQGGDGVQSGSIAELSDPASAISDRDIDDTRNGERTGPPEDDPAVGNGGSDTATKHRRQRHVVEPVLPTPERTHTLGGVPAMPD